MEIVSTGQWQPGDANAVSIEGKPHDARVTVLLEHMPAGTGPRLHSHPYGETWVVVEGRIGFSDGKK
jgi:quercetin dioxygenase-like cupin family protein